LESLRIHCNFRHTHCRRAAVHAEKDAIKERAIEQGAACSTARAFSLGPLTLKGKGGAKAFVQQWLRTSYPSYTVTDDDLPWVLACFSMHPKFDQKMEGWNGVISVEFTDNNYHFAIHKQQDDPIGGGSSSDEWSSWIDISYLKCFSASCGKNDIFRLAVQDQILDF
jgi:hypothetical protein